jgi:hypothetical protein
MKRHKMSYFPEERDGFRSLDYAIDEIPDQLLKRVLSDVGKFRCKVCGVTVWGRRVAGHNSEVECDCGNSMTLVG